MKKAIVILLVLIFLFCSCAEETNPKMLPRGNSMVITLLSPNLGGELHFSDFDGENFLASRFVMPTGTDDPLPENASFLINPENGVAIKQDNFEPYAVSDGEYYYNIKRTEEGTVLAKRPWWSDESENLFSIVNDSVATIYRSGKYIIAASEFEKNLHLEFYNTENETHHSGILKRNIETPKILGVPTNGYICIAEKTSEGYLLKAVDPDNPEKLISSDGNVHKEIFCAAFDGKNFVFSTDEGMFFCIPGGEPEIITRIPIKNFAFIKGNFVVYPAAGDSDGNGNILCYNLEHKSLSVVLEGSYNIELIADSENTVVFRTIDSAYGCEYVTLQWIPRTKVYEEGEDNTMPYMIQANGIQYAQWDTAEAPAEEYILGKITSCIDDITEAPTRDGQTNYSPALGCYYAIVDGVFYASERSFPDGVLKWSEYKACK